MWSGRGPENEKRSVERIIVTNDGVSKLEGATKRVSARRLFSDKRDLLTADLTHRTRF